MKNYIGTKQVKAEPCTLGEFVEKEEKKRYNNNIKINALNIPGYLVEYEDGKRAWQPKDQFEKNNKLYKK